MISSPALKDELTAFELHRTCLAVHGEVFQIHGTGEDKRQPGKQTAAHAVMSLTLQIEINGVSNP